MFKKKQTIAELLSNIIQCINDEKSPDIQLSQIGQLIQAQMTPEQQTQLVQYFYNNNLLLILTKKFKNLSFEARKDACMLINYISKRAITGDILVGNQKSPLSSYVQSRPEILDLLLTGLNQELSLNFGQVIKDLIKRQEVVEMFLDMLKCDKFVKLFSIMNSNIFETSSEAMMLFKNLLTTNKIYVNKFILDIPDFFIWYQELLKSQNFATKLFSLTLLGDILLDAQFQDVMIFYVQSEDNLKVIMCLLRDQSNKVKIAAFDIFKIFIINPDKTPLVVKILYKNKEKLLDYLETFSIGNESLEDEKQVVIQELRHLEDVVK
ncbi:Mo25 family protein [Spironucleus salmonicida]|uniref:Mo25 family protein n=1 Tax=Spironucleus salmonicida TaxID=348837 RepID=V6LL18_9EUKA|nr:Mo25 family protein [Spironucleus salmonicida]|eukprot:EST45325.1 Mo25 family protein [Spironucleus salmonicida]